MLLLFHDPNPKVAYAALPSAGAAVRSSIARTRGIVILAEPLNATSLMLRAVWSVVAVAAFPVVLLDVVALPDREAVIVPALKLPEPSRATMAPPVFAFVALEVTVNVELPD